MKSFQQRIGVSLTFEKTMQTLQILYTTNKHVHKSCLLNTSAFAVNSIVIKRRNFIVKLTYVLI